MIYVNIRNVLDEKGKSKYWFIKEMEGSYQAMSKLIDNQTISIRFNTLEKICTILDCEPGDILIKKE